VLSDHGWLDWIVYHSFVVLGILLLIIALLQMIYQRRSPSSMIAWLLAIILLPYLAVPFYFIVGFRKRRKKKTKSAFSLQAVDELPDRTGHPIDAVLRSNGIPGTTRGNRFELYTDGVEAYRTLMAQIEQAQKSILISTYILNNDRVGKTVIGALARKAQEGVKVQLLIDSLGSFPLYFFQHPLKALRKAGGEVLFFMPILRMPLRNYINLRNHRKIFLFDGKTVLTGGMNLSSEYLGPDPDTLRWDDLLFLAEGPAVFHYREIFVSDWAYAAQKEALISQEIPYSDGDALMQVVPSGPDIPGDALFEALISAIHAAKERIWIVTPYFVPDASLMQALTIAHHKGVDIKLITPRESDNPVADLVRSSYMRELEEEGMHVALFEGAMLHAKAILFDSTSTMLGSVNIDNRSLLLNYEVVSFAYSAPIIAEIESWMSSLLEHSGQQMKPAGRIRRIGENLMRIIAPQL
jgi:cardiolipin synthase